MKYNGLMVGVFFKHREWAEQWFNDFISKIDHSCILRFVKNGVHPFMIELKDGTRITAYDANEKARGICIDKAFVESAVGDEIINAVIRPLIGHKNFVEVEY